MVVSASLMPPVSYRNRRIARRLHLSLLRTAAGALTTVIALLLLSTAAAGSTSSRGHTVVVGPGQSLWSIATAAPAGQDLRQRVDELISVNHLSPSGNVAAGQEIFVPED